MPGRAGSDGEEEGQLVDVPLDMQQCWRRRVQNRDEARKEEEPLHETTLGASLKSVRARRRRTGVMLWIEVIGSPEGQESR